MLIINRMLVEKNDVILIQMFVEMPLKIKFHSGMTTNVEFNIEIV